MWNPFFCSGFPGQGFVHAASQPLVSFFLAHLVSIAPPPKSTIIFEEKNKIKVLATEINPHVELV